MNDKKIVVIGGGTLGSQVAYQCTYCGFDTTIWLRSNYYVEETKQKLNDLEKYYLRSIEEMKAGKAWANGIATAETFDYEKCLETIKNVNKNIKIDTDIVKVLENADIVFELIPDILEEKITLYKSLSKVLPENAILVAGSSVILPSQLSKYLTRQDKYVAAHFSNPLFKNNICEIMAGPKTSNETYNAMLSLAKDINTVSIPVRKENNGYIMNAMLIPLLFSALDMVARGVSDYESIDKAWTIGARATAGPFQIIDRIGLKTMYNLVLGYVKIPSFLAPYNFKAIEKLLRQYIDNGKLGKTYGEGFYRYGK